MAQPIATETTYGNPSANASDSMAVLGYLAYCLNKEWLWATTVLSVALIGFSRLYLGVQFPLSVLSGWLLGLGVVLLLLKVDSLSLAKLNRLSTAWQVGIAFGVSLFIVLVGGGIIKLISASPDPSAWAGFAAQARSLTENYTLAGGIFRAACGYILMKKHLDFQTTGTLMTKAGRCLLGFAGMGLIYFSLRWVIDRILLPETISLYILYYIHLALLTFLVSFAAPWCFLKFKLAQPGIA